jgi:acyl-CoA reductase-like NAD-dependent aldehyde dehydrogenase
VPWNYPLEMTARSQAPALATGNAGGVETPFGGTGKSGYGRETGREALWNYVQTKNIGIRMG